MDKSRFDDIIKEKLELHVDPIGPSGSEVTRLFEELPNVTAVATSVVSKVLVAASTLLFITSVFFIYRTYILEDTISSMRHEIIKLGNSEPEINIMADTVFWDSLEVITNRVVTKNKATQNSAGLSSITSTIPTGTYYQQFQLSAQDSQRFVNDIMAQLVATLESNPELLQELMSQLPRVESNDDNGENPDFGTSTMTPDELKTRIVRNLDDQGVVEEILIRISTDSVESKRLLNIITRNDPSTSEEDQLGLFTTTKSTETSIADLSDERQLEVLEEYLDQNPQKVAEVAQTMQMDDSSLSRIQQYAAMEDLEGKKSIDLDSLRLDLPIALTAQEVREGQGKISNRAFLIGAGLGTGTVNLDELGNGTTSSIKLAAEYTPQPRFGFSSGIELYRTEVESYKINEVDFSPFTGLPTDIGSTAKEIKVALQWMDIPLEAKLYLIPNGKFNPYLGISVRARALLKEEYKIETTTDMDFVPGFTSGTKLAFPAYGYSLGTMYKLNPKLNGALQFQHMFGGEDMGLFGNHYNPIQVQGILFFEL
ncbi:MAG: hypothetical protein ABJG78_13335 [Cyclobacteriaceae bacterium]